MIYQKFCKRNSASSIPSSPKRITFIPLNPDRKECSAWLAKRAIWLITATEYSKAKSRLVDRLLLIAEGGDL